MALLKETNFVFIAGVEGSGTTMMSRLLQELDGFVSLGGNHFTQGYEKYARELNHLTEQLWAIPRLSEANKQHALGQLNALPLPEAVKTCVYKRSYPFLTSGYMPDLGDLRSIGKNYKVVLLRRHFFDNVRSILRRQFEAQENIAIQRIAQGYMHLTQQLLRLEQNKWLSLDYEKIIDERTKLGELERLAHFLGIKTELIQQHAGLIGRPTGG